jgi:hypothetical protein
VPYPAVNQLAVDSGFYCAAAKAPPAAPAPCGIAGNGGPLPHCRYYLREYALGLGRCEPEVGGYLPSQVKVQRISRFANVELETLPVSDAGQRRARDVSIGE